MPLRSYQRIEVDRAWVPFWAYYADPRMGKTRICTHVSVRWIQEFGVKRILITGPLEALDITWDKELRMIKCLRPSEEGDRIAHLVSLLAQPIAKSRFKGRKKIEKTLVPSRISVLQDLAKGAAGDTPVIVLVNDDVLGMPIRKPTAKDPHPPRVYDFIMAWGPEAVIGDESHRYQHAGAQRSAALRRIALAEGVRFRRLLSGTPDPKRGVSFYHQFKILDPSVFGTSKKKFLQDWFYTAGQYGNYVLGPRNEQALFDKVRSRASILRAQDYFDTPPTEEVRRDVRMDETRVAWYKKFVKEQQLEISALGIDVTATHVLSRLVRCQQFTSGFLPTENEDGEGDVVWLHDAKIDAVVGDCSEILASGGKVIVSHLFVPEGVRLVAALRKRYGERTVLQLSRKTPDREAVIAPFSLDHEVESEARILVKSEKIGGYGLSLARADHLIMPSWSMNFADVDQNRKRIWHQDKRRMTVTYVTVPSTVDATALRNIQHKGEASIMARSFTFEQLATGAAA